MTAPQNDDAISETSEARSLRQASQIMLQLGGTTQLDRAVSVSMPRSLPELQHLAAQHFGHSGCLRLYHMGIHLLYHPTQMNQVKDGDLIVVRRSEIHRPTTAPGAPAVISTHQADFTRKPFQRPKTGAGNDYESALTERTKGVPLDGMSRYATDFVKHPIEPCIPYKPPSALELHDEPLGTTTYSREFPWIESRRPKTSIDDQAVRQSSLSLAMQGEKFQGKTSYRTDFPRHNYQTPRELAMIPGLLQKTSVQPIATPFASVSTYADDFKKHGRGRQRCLRPKDDARMNEPFSGTSEYRREYHELALTDRSEKLYIASAKLVRMSGDDHRQAGEELRRQAEETLLAKEIIVSDAAPDASSPGKVVVSEVAVVA